MRPRRITRYTAVMAAAVLGVVGLTAGTGSAAYSTSPRVTYSANKPVFAITVHGDRVYIGGRFTSVKNLTTGQVVSRDGLAAFDRSTGELITSFDPSVIGEVRAIAVSAAGDRLYVGGTFTSVNGASRSNLAAVDDEGALVTDWDVPASKTVRDLVRVGDSLFLAGTFGTVAGANRGGLAKLVASTGELTPWKVPTLGGKPRSVVPSPNGTDLIVGGAFTSLGGQPRSYLGAATLDSGVVTAWAPPGACDSCDIWDVAVADDAVYAAAAGPGGRVARWSLTTGDRQWSVWADGDVQAVAVADGVVYAGGHYGPKLGSVIRNQLAALDASTGQVLPWAPDLGIENSPGVWALDAGPDFLRVGGGFRSFDGTPQARYAELPYQ